MSLRITPTHNPRSNPEVKLVPILSQGPGPRTKSVELHVSNDGKTAVVKLNSLEAATLGDSLKASVR